MSTAKLTAFLIVLICLIIFTDSSFGMSSETKQKMKSKVLEMFNHAYGSYMKNAFPADELMPLSCKGRYRDTEPGRGDMDDALGNFTLTLIDTLDTLAVIGDIPEFERAVKLVINTSRFDTDVIVSVFETNIRVLGGLLGGHVIAAYLKRRKYSMEWYKDELLTMARDVGNRLLPAFNTSTGMPYSRINLKYGIQRDISSKYKDTCTACAGTMILEFAALSRLTGDPIYEEKAHKAMDYLWNQRHRSSDLVGTVINIHNGDWIRRESGVGAGIDSYYEYVLKAYILLGDDTYLTRFNKHYDAIMKYVSQGPLFMDVHMHKPRATSRNFMDALLAFWPGLQVLKGDIQPAIEMHEMLYQVMQRHNFLPEAFTSDFHVHWGNHPLRPEFVESTYFLYKATGDPYYLEAGRMVLDNLEKHARVECGYAAIKDVTQGTHEDQMDSYVLAETFKYMYLLYAEKSDLLFDVDDYIFTTEAHLLPLSLSRCNTTRDPAMRLNREMYRHLQSLEEESRDMDEFGDSEHNTCPNPQIKYKESINYAQNLRASLKDLVGKKSPAPRSTQPQCSGRTPSADRLKATEFVSGNKDQLQQLRDMGISLVTMSDGRIQLLHTASDALTPQLAEDGLAFMQEMIELSKTQPQETNQHEAMYIHAVTQPYSGQVFKGGPAQFGYDLRTRPSVQGLLQLSQPFKACTPIINTPDMRGRIAILERGECMFVDKARNLQAAGAVAGIVIDHTLDSTSVNQPLFAMSGDGKDDVHIPLLFLFHKEGQLLLDMWGQHPELQVMLSAQYTGVIAESPASEPSGPEKSSADVPQQSVPETDQSEPYIERLFELNQLESVGEDGEYRIGAGTENVHIKVKMHSPDIQPIIPQATDDNVINIKTLSDGTRQLYFKFDHMVKEGEAPPSLAKLYESVLNTLNKKTNFLTLEKQSEYLTAIVSLLESAYTGKSQVDIKTQDLFSELSNELEIAVTVEEVGRELEEEEQSSVVQEQTETQSENSKQYPEIPDTEEIHVFESAGIGIRIKSKAVVHAREEAVGHDSERESYANQDDFEAPVDHGARRKEDAPIDASTVNKEELSGVSKESEQLDALNPDLRIGIDDAIDRASGKHAEPPRTSNIEAPSVNVRKGVKFAKTVHNLKSPNIRNFQEKAHTISELSENSADAEISEKSEQTDSISGSRDSSRKQGDL